MEFARHSLRHTFTILYKEPYNAFGIIDHQGKSYVTLEDFLNSFVATRSGLFPEEIIEFFELQGVFRSGKGQLIFAKFRELFFPHMTLAGEDPPNFDPSSVKKRDTDGQDKKATMAEIQKRLN